MKDRDHREVVTAFWVETNQCIVNNVKGYSPLPLRKSEPSAFLENLSFFIVKFRSEGRHRVIHKRAYPFLKPWNRYSLGWGMVVGNFNRVLHAKGVCVGGGGEWEGQYLCLKPFSQQQR